MSRAGGTPLLSKFQQGNIIVLESKASNKSLRINNGEVEGTGGRGTWAQFYVHVRRPGVVALQNVSNIDHWLAIRDGKLLGTGRGGPFCEFRLNEVGDNLVALESVRSPGQHVGILPDGSAKAPGSTGTGQHGRFEPAVLSELSKFQQGNIIVLESKASNKSLRINNGEVEGTGGRGTWAQFYVHLRRPGVVALQNVSNSDHWLAIRDNQLVTGRGGRYCEFRVHDLEGDSIALESVVYDGHHVGILPDGSAKAPGSTGTGQHGRFVPVVIVEEGVLTSFKQGAIVVLESKASNKSLRINNGEVEGKGAKGTWAQFYVHVRRPGVVALQNVNNTDHWLAARDNKLVTGKGGQYCEFYVRDVGDDDEIALESTMYPGQHVGILPDGSAKAPGSTGTGAHGRFKVIILSDVSQFKQGNIIVLESKASNKSLRINNGEVEGTGGQGTWAQFYVHVRRPGVVALQNVGNPSHWLAIRDDKLIGTGRGGPYCEFRVRDLEGDDIALESIMCPGQHVGILPDGSAKAPGSTGTGAHGRFVPVIL